MVCQSKRKKLCQINSLLKSLVMDEDYRMEKNDRSFAIDIIIYLKKKLSNNRRVSFASIGKPDFFIVHPFF